MLNRIWHLIGVAALVVGGVLAISRGPDGDAYSVLAFLVVVVGVAALTRAKPEACGWKKSRRSKLGSRFHREAAVSTNLARQLNGQSGACFFDFSPAQIVATAPDWPHARPAS